MKALILVDVQHDFFKDGPLAVPHAESILPNLNRLTQAFFRANLPVFACRDWHPVGHKSFSSEGGPYPEHCIQGSKGADLHHSLLQNGITVVDKAYHVNDLDMSAFADGRLLEMLELSVVQSVYLAGISMEFGIKATALDALKLGLDTYLINEAIISCQPRHATKTVAELGRAGGQFVSIDQVLEHLPKASIV